VAQAGYWDVDGTGIQRIDDPDVARKLRDRVGFMNGRTAAIAVAATAVFAALPTPH